MKTARRHELQTNELADWLGAKIEAIKPYSRAMLGALVAVAVILGVYMYLSRERAATQAQGWDRYFNAWEQMRTNNNSDDMSELAGLSAYRDTAAGLWARVALGDYNFAQGEVHSFSDRAQAKRELQTAVDSYSSVANQRAYPLLAQRAPLGKARAQESLDEQEDARKSYQALADEDGSPYQEEAKRRLADLSRDSTKRFYDWFAQQNPSPRSPFSPGAPGLPPDFDFKSFDPNSSLFDRTPPAGDSQDAGPEKSGTETPAEKTSAGKAAAKSADAAGPAITPPAEGAKAPGGSEKKPSDSPAKTPANAAPANPPSASPPPKGDGKK